MPHSPAPNTAPVPGTYARTLLVAALAGNAYLGYFQYKAEGFSALDSLDDRLRGLADAPDQYRMGVYLVAHAMAAHLHITPTLALTLINVVAGLFAALLLFGIFERSGIYARAGRTVQWLGAMAFVLLILWTLPWTLFPEKPETLPAAAGLAALMWLWAQRLQPQQSPTPRPAWLTIPAVLAVSCALATFRADLACLFQLGLLAYVLLVARAPSLSLPRPTAAITAFIAALGAAGMQLWLAHVVYPQAGYGRVKLWQLRPNLIHATRWPPFVVFTLPLLWLLAQGLRRGFVRDPLGRAVLTAALLYMALWATVGKLDEVRVFLPFAWALAPLTAQHLLSSSKLATGQLESGN